MYLYMNLDLNVDPEKILTIGELAEPYPRQWLAVNVVERDNNGQPVKVKVIKRGVDAFSARVDTGTTSFCTLYTGPVPELRHVGMF